MPDPPVDTASAESRTIGLRNGGQRPPEEHGRGDPADASEEEKCTADLTRSRHGWPPRRRPESHRKEQHHLDGDE